MQTFKYIAWFNEVDKEDLSLVGGKGANLGEMTKAGFPVPNGFIVTSKAYYDFVKQNNLAIKIKNLLGRVEFYNPASLKQASLNIKKEIMKSDMCSGLVQEIHKAYRRISGTLHDAFVAIRSSSITKDTVHASSAGQLDSFLSVKGDANVILKIKEVWASLFSNHAIFYRHENELDHLKVGVAVPVQKMLDFQKSGVMFTIDPVSKDKTLVVIDIAPGHYKVNKSNDSIIEKNVVSQKSYLKDEEIIQLARIGKKLEKHYYFPQHVEWVIEKNKIYVLRTKPLTTIVQRLVARNSELVSSTVLEYPKTATKVYVNLSQPELAKKVSLQDTDGIGLLRSEFIMAQIGIHPKKFLRTGKKDVFISRLSEGLRKFCDAFNPRPVIYRASILKTNEYYNLVGGREFEPIESNPMLGFRGAVRYINDPEVFNLELEAIKLVRSINPCKNLWMMIPFIRTVKELIEVKKLISKSGLYKSSNFKIWMMIEIPSNVILLEKFINVGIDGVSVDYNDLTMLILGIDRDNNDISHLFDEQNDAVLWALERIIKTCNKYNVTSSICGQAISDKSSLLEKLVRWGITSVSVSPDAVNSTRKHIAEFEKQIISK